MAVVKAKYAKNKQAAKAHVRYIQNRRGKDGEKKQRTLFGHDGGAERQQAYELIDEAKTETMFYKIMISPDPKTEDIDQNLNLWKITTKTIEELEKRLQQKNIQFVAAVHNDHKPHRHIHIVACIEGRLNIPDLQSLRLSATQAAIFQRKELDLARNAREREKAQGIKPELELSL